MKKKKITFILFLISIQLKAQFDAQFSQYWACKTYYNPGSTGSTQGVNVTLNHRQQWLGMPGAPKSFFLGIDLPISKWGKNHGIGINLFKDYVGQFNNSLALINYAYKLKLSNGTLSLGTQFGLINESFDGSKTNIKDFTDPAHSTIDEAIPNTNEQAMNFDMGLGAHFSTENLYAGISITHLLNPIINLSETSSVFVGRLFYLDGGMDHPLEGSKIILRPSFLMKTDFRILVVDLTMRAEFNKKFCGGLTYRWKNAFVASFGVNLKDVSLGYSYDISTSKLFNTTFGSHEASVKYNFDLAIQNKSKRRINKTVRFL